MVLVSVLPCASCAPMGLLTRSDGKEINGGTAWYGDPNDPHCLAPRIGLRAVSTASVLVRGTSAGRPVWGRVWIGVDHSTRSLRVESAAPAQFILTAERALLAADDTSDGAATLYLPPQHRVVQRASSRALLDAVLGLPLPAHEFVWAFTGCQNITGNIDERAFGPNLARVSMGNALPLDVFLRRANPQTSWTVFAMSRASQTQAFRWWAEYRRNPEKVLQSVRIVSEEPHGAIGRLFDLDLTLSRIQYAPLVGPEVFTPVRPSTARPVPLETWQRQRPRSSLPLVNALKDR